MSGSDCRAEVGLGMFAVDAGFLLALRSVTGNDNIPNLNTSDSSTNALHNSSSLMSEDDGEDSFRVASIQGVDISMAQSIGDDFDSHFSSLGRIDLNLLNNHGLLGPVGYCSLADDDLRFAHPKYLIFIV